MHDFCTRIGDIYRLLMPLDVVNYYFHISVIFLSLNLKKFFRLFF